MNNINYSIEKPENEKVLSYAPGCPERSFLESELSRQSEEIVDIPAFIGGKEIRTGDLVDVRMPHEHSHVLARFHRCGKAEIASACDAAGNFYINDKPTGAVVGRQPFGGGRGSGTNDKAGSHLNLLRWVTTRTVKENFAPPLEYSYPFLG